MVLARIKARLHEELERPVDIASMAFFRIAFGLTMTIASIRFMAHGWIALDYIAPKYFFHYWGFAWVHPWAGNGMYVHYGIMLLAAIGIMLGFAYRTSCAVFGVTFTYAHLCDKSNYLNHYYLVTLLAFLMVFLPLDRKWSIRTLRRPNDTCEAASSWTLWLLRFQIALVYLFAGIAKVQWDWLIHGEPLRIWLSANAEMPLLGGLFQRVWFAIVFSWCGMFFDLTIVPLLLWRQSRRLAYPIVVVFHGMTSILFHIGIFPWLMSVAATIFFDPSWPRRFVGRRDSEEPNPKIAGGSALRRTSYYALGIYAILQLLIPLRHVLYPGNTLWTEEAFRFSWKVMLIEKSGDFELTVVDREGRRNAVNPREYLTPFQTRMVSTQPDMMLEFAHIVADDYARRGLGPVAVYADAQVSFNGRRRRTLIDPNVDLARESDGLRPKTWILPAPTDAPEF